MGFNMYKQISNIQAELIKQGYKDKVPIDVFGEYLMTGYGMKKTTAIRWIELFQAVNLISVRNGEVSFK